MARISIGMPVFNGERFVAEAVESLLAQTMSDFELIISDNASTDRTYDICEAFARKDARVSLHRNLENIGAAANFNRVFRLARSSYFKWAACDDLYSPNYLEKCSTVLDEQPNVILCHARTEEINEGGQSMGFDDAVLRLDSPDPVIRFRDMIVMRHACTIVFGLIRREVLARTPLIGKYVSSDRVLLSELALIGPMVELAEPLYKRRKHRSNSVWLDKRGELLSWFDPTQAGKINLPYWRAWAEMRRAVARQPLTSKARVRCYVALLEHALGKRPELVRDLVVGTRKHITRLHPVSAVVSAVRDRVRDRTRAE